VVPSIPGHGALRLAAAATCRWGTAGERGRRRWWGVGGSSRGAAAEGVVGSDGSGKRNRRERWRVNMEGGKMTDRGRGAAEPSRPTR
jgi:hypothetical protein